MENKLDDLARQLQRCRERGNKLTLECVLESARILTEAKALAGRKWTQWVREKGRMDPLTARHHLSVANFARRNRDLTHEITSLSIAKIYKLATLDSDLARSLILGRTKLSRPLPQLSDVQFRKDCRGHFGSKPGKTTKEHVFRATHSALLRAERSLHRALHYARKMTPIQRKRIYDKVAAISNLLAEWKVVA